MAQTKNEAEIRLKYNVSGFIHKMTIPVRFDTADPPSGTDPLVVLKDATTATTSAVVATWTALLLPVFNGDMSWESFEVWDLKRDADGFEISKFIFAGSATGTGTFGGTNTDVKQETILYRSTNGKVGRVVVLGTAGGIAYTRVARPFPTDKEAIAAYMEGNTSPFVHGDGGRVANVYAITETSNNALERRIYGRG